MEKRSNSYLVRPHQSQLHLIMCPTQTLDRQTAGGATVLQRRSPETTGAARDHDEDGNKYTRSYSLVPEEMDSSLHQFCPPIALRTDLSHIKTELWEIPVLQMAH